MSPNPTFNNKETTEDTNVNLPHPPSSTQDIIPTEGGERMNHNSAKQGKHFSASVFLPRSPKMRHRSSTEVSLGDKYNMDEVVDASAVTESERNVNHKGHSNTSKTHSKDSSNSSRNNRRGGPIQHIRKGLHARKERREFKSHLRRLSIGDYEKEDGGGEEGFLSEYMNGSSSWDPPPPPPTTTPTMITEVPPMVQIQRNYQKLSRYKQNISWILEKTTRMNKKIKHVSKKMIRLSNIISKLQNQLDAASKALDIQRNQLHKNITSLNDLNTLRHSLEDKVNGIHQEIFFITSTTTASSNSTYSPRHLINTHSIPPTCPMGYDSSSLDSSHRNNSNEDDDDDDDSYVTALEEGDHFHFDELEKDILETSNLVRQMTTTSDHIHDDDNNSLETSLSDDDDDDDFGNIVKNTSSTTLDLDSDVPSAAYLRVDDLDLLFHETSLSWSVSRPREVLMLPSDAKTCQIVVNALTQRALHCIVDDNTMWIPERSTERILSKYSPSDTTCTSTSSSYHWYPVLDKSNILLWSGKFDSNIYGNDLPVIKARGFISCSPRALMDMLVDSSQVKEYNKISLGRTDEWVIHQGVDTPTADGTIGETKISRSTSKIPLIRKPIEFWTLMHARTLDPPTIPTPYHMKGYIVVTRSLWEDEDRVPTMESRGSTMMDGNASTIRSEVLLSVNLIRAVVNDRNGEATERSNQCELTTMNHMYSPCAPSIGAKQLGLKAAYNFIRDLQTYFDSMG